MSAWHLLTGALAVLSLFVVNSWAQLAPVEVTRVDFSQDRAPGIAGQWIEVLVELEGGPSLESEATGNPRFNSMIKVTLSIAFQAGRRSDNRFEFFRAQATVATLEQGQRVELHFYLPPGVVERDRLDKEPFAWLVQLAVNGTPLPNLPGQYSESLSDPERARNFMTRLEQMAPRNEGVLQPIYLTPFYVEETGKFRFLPDYVRPQPVEPGESPAGLAP